MWLRCGTTDEGYERLFIAYDRRLTRVVCDVADWANPFLDCAKFYLLISVPFLCFLLREEFSCIYQFVILLLSL